MKSLTILITAGPTREKIDPVRFISNRSSGKMGYALAATAADMGHKVILISGPVNLQPPNVHCFIKIENAEEMAEEVKLFSEKADIIIMAAAVADYRPIIIEEQKIKKSKGNLVIELERTEDILKSLGKEKKEGQILVGFAAETNDIKKNALKKLKSKNLDWIVANDVSQANRGFAVDLNEVIMYSADGDVFELPLESKLGISEKILNTILDK
jgi:phosphopantothenoylcysteine decarboxylase/phosphopantothenate--cysteine ligase